MWYSRIEMAVALFVAFCINLAIVSTNATSFFSYTCATADDGPFACLSHSAYALVNGPPIHPTPTAGLGASCVVGAFRPGHVSTSATTALAGVGAVKGHCGEIGLENAGSALEDTIGNSSLVVWALGMLAAGQASTMVCTYAGQIIMSGLLSIELPPWKRVALTRVIALGPALAVAVTTTSIPGMLNSVNECLNILQSILLPFAMLPVLHFSASSTLLGQFRSPPLLMAVSTTLALVVLATNAVLVWRVVDALEHPLVIGAWTLGAAVYTSVCVRFVWDDLRASARRVRRAIGSSCTIVRYKLEDCWWTCCGLSNRRSGDHNGGDSNVGILDADATIEGELLGRLLTTEGLVAAAAPSGSAWSGGAPSGSAPSGSARSGSAPIGSARSGSGRKATPRNLSRDLEGPGACGGGGGSSSSSSRSYQPPSVTGRSDGVGVASTKADFALAALAELAES